MRVFMPQRRLLFVYVMDVICPDVFRGVPTLVRDICHPKKRPALLSQTR